MLLTVGGRIQSEDAELTRGGRRHAPDHAHGRALARAVRAEEAEDLARVDVHIDAVDRDEVVEGLHEASGFDEVGTGIGHGVSRYRPARGDP